MALGDGLEKFEAVLGAFANISGEREDPGLGDARCPKCNASDFMKVEERYDQAVRRLSNSVDEADVVRDGQISDANALVKFRPPMRKSLVPRVIGAAIVLGVVTYLVFRFFGDNPGKIAAMFAGALLVGFGLTSARNISDNYYDGRARWRKLFLCRQCGQVVKG